MTGTTESDGEHDVEMHGGLRDEIIEMEWNDDEHGEQEDHGREGARLRNCTTPKVPSETGMRELHCSGRERDHHRKGDQEGLGIPEYHMDYCFFGDE